MKPGGRLALIFRTSAHKAAVKAFPSDVYRFPESVDVVAALAAAGLTLNEDDAMGTPDQSEPMLLTVTKSAV